MNRAPFHGVLAVPLSGLFVSLGFFLPLTAHSAVLISEVMYDPEGSDTKHEWIEVTNDGVTVDLSDWKVFEGGTNHKLTLFSASPNLSSGGYAVIADDAETFLSDYPSFTGILFDTAFTGGLNNTNGETITIRDGELNDISSLSFDVAIGAAGDGNSLQKSSATWVSAMPTPGFAYSGTQTQTSETASSNINTTITTSTTDTPIGGVGPVAPQMFVDAGEDATVVVGSGTVFSANAVGLKNETLPNARYVWNFGNGESREGKSVLFSYAIPGTYVVSVDASSGPYSASDRITVVAIPADIRITEITSEYVALANNSSHELDIGFWQIANGEGVFVFPARSIIMPRSKVKVSATTLGYAVTSTSTLSLLYPHGGVAGTFGGSVFMSQEPIPATDSGSTATRVTKNANRAQTMESDSEVRQDSLVASVAASGVLGSSAGVPFWVWVSILLVLILVSSFIVSTIRGKM